LIDEKKFNEVSVKIVINCKRWGKKKINGLIYLTDIAYPKTGSEKLAKGLIPFVCPARAEKIEELRTDGR